MAIYVFDSSALLKRYAREAGTEWVRAVFRKPESEVYVARITGAEVIAAIRRKTRLTDPADRMSVQDAARIAAAFRRHFASEYAVVEITAPIVEDAMDLIERHKLRGYDGVQLAAARAVAARAAAVSPPLGPAACTLVTTDNDLETAATAEGLLVFNPRHVP